MRKTGSARGKSTPYSMSTIRCLVLGGTHAFLQEPGIVAKSREIVKVLCFKIIEFQFELNVLWEVGRCVSFSPITRQGPCPATERRDTMVRDAVIRDDAVQRDTVKASAGRRQLQATKPQATSYKLLEAWSLPLEAGRWHLAAGSWRLTPPDASTRTRRGSPCLSPPAGAGAPSVPLPSPAARRGRGLPP